MLFRSLADHVSKVARMRYPTCAVPSELVHIISQMGIVASEIIRNTAVVISNRDTDGALQIEKDDDKMDQLHRELFIKLLEPGWSHGIETAIDVTLIGRYYERFSDHAVSVARRLYYLVTGEYANQQS